MPPGGRCHRPPGRGERATAPSRSTIGGVRPRRPHFGPPSGAHSRHVGRLPPLPAAPTSRGSRPGLVGTRASSHQLRTSADGHAATAPPASALRTRGRERPGRGEGRGASGPVRPLSVGTGPDAVLLPRHGGEARGPAQGRPGPRRPNPLDYADRTSRRRRPGYRGRATGLEQRMRRRESQRMSQIPEKETDSPAPPQTKETKR
jgi:hypothetical protein